MLTRRKGFERANDERRVLIVGMPTTMQVRAREAGETRSRETRTGSRENRRVATDEVEARGHGQGHSKSSYLRHHALGEVSPNG